MKRFFIVLVLNLIFVGILMNLPKSDFYHIWEQKNLIEYYTVTLQHTDGISYLNPPPKDMLRTIGYLLLLKGLRAALPVNWYIALILINCLLGAWLFHVIWKIVPNKKMAWLLVPLGSFTAYIHFIGTDILFAALFITSIWQAKEKRLWLHFLLLGAASIVRPSLAWFFLIEPAVLYFYGIKNKQILIASLFICFSVTQFNTVRNYVNHGQWTHSPVMRHNLNEIYGKTEYPKYLFLINTFKINYLESHWAMYKHKFSKLSWACIAAPFVIINGILWVFFLHRIYRHQVNWGNMLILIYFVGPSMFGPTLGRIRLPIEWILLL
ncbi:hypothetical protein LCGC14_2080810 [marine sediment metagenome]|uniref:Uncharacterized protein n=1 Tax=marine sediment metagenome TaxID=412755 RepID=A0A0F9EFK3_9ZZZZ